MAQIDLRFFSPMERDKQLEIADLSKRTVAYVHYGHYDLRPGTITLAAPRLDMEVSDSDAAYELEISEGSNNWPRASWVRRAIAHQTVHDYAKAALEDRAERISATLREMFTDDSHNIFEVSGQATGFVQYKPVQE